MKLTKEKDTTQEEKLADSCMCLVILKLLLLECMHWLGGEIG